MYTKIINGDKLTYDTLGEHVLFLSDGRDVVPQYTRIGKDKPVLWNECDEYTEDKYIISQDKIDLGGFKGHIFIQVIDKDYWGLDHTEENRYVVSMGVVKSLDSISRDKLQDIADESGYEDTSFDDVRIEDLLYGGYYNSYLGISLEGNNPDEMVERLKEQFYPVSAMIVFYLDKPANGIGDNGWYFLDRG